MENGLVSQHAYTVTGAEQVRLPWAGPQCSCSFKQESESHAFSKPSKTEMSIYHPRPLVASIMDSLVPSSVSSGVQDPHPPETHQRSHFP